MYHGVLFDLDGVLFDTEPIHRLAWIEAMKSLGHSITEESLMQWTGIPCLELARFYEQTISPRLDRSVYHRRKGEYFRQLAPRMLEPFSGLIDIVAQIARRVSVAHVTSNDRIDADLMLGTTGFDRLLPIGVAYEEVSRHKPAPDPYLAGAARLEIAPSQCVALEDSPSGIASARSAGMAVAGIASTFPMRELKDATRVFPSSLEGAEWVLALLREPN